MEPAARQRAKREPSGIAVSSAPPRASGSLKKCQTAGWPKRSAWGLPAKMAGETSPERLQTCAAIEVSVNCKSTRVRSQEWLPSRGPTDRHTTSPTPTVTGGSGPKRTSLAPCETPEANVWRVAPRRSSSTQLTPLPHSVWECCTKPSTLKVPATGPRHPTITRREGDGCTATLWGRIRPGTRTSRSEELAVTLKASAAVQPWMKEYPCALSSVEVISPSMRVPPERIPSASNHAAKACGSRFLERANAVSASPEGTSVSSAAAFRHAAA